jgi:hypothetical protein
MLLRCCAGLRSDASCLAQTHTCTRCTFPRSPSPYDVLLRAQVEGTKRHVISAAAAGPARQSAALHIAYPARAQLLHRIRIARARLHFAGGGCALREAVRAHAAMNSLNPFRKPDTKGASRSARDKRCVRGADASARPQRCFGSRREKSAAACAVR